VSQTHWKKLTNPDYIGAHALTPGEDLTVTIKTVRRQLVTQTGGSEKECTVATLDGHKPLILNATNSKSIQKLYGPYIEDWQGKQITLYASTTTVANEVVECVRIRPVVGEAKKRAINDAALSKALGAVQAGTYTLEQILSKYELTPEQLERLPKQIEGGTI
jgi:hypothetical protein